MNRTRISALVSLAALAIKAIECGAEESFATLMTQYGRQLGVTADEATELAGMTIGELVELVSREEVI